MYGKSSAKAIKLFLFLIFKFEKSKMAVFMLFCRNRSVHQCRTAGPIGLNFFLNNFLLSAEIFKESKTLQKIRKI